MSSNNVVMWPKHYDGPPKDIDDMADVIDSREKDYIEYALSEVIPILFHEMEMFRFSFDDDRFHKDKAIVIDAIRSIMYAAYNRPHLIQDTAEQMYCMKSLGEDKQLIPVYNKKHPLYTKTNSAWDDNDVECTANN